LSVEFEELEDLVEATKRLKDGGIFDKVQLFFLEKSAHKKSQQLIDSLYDMVPDYLEYYNSEIDDSTRIKFAEAKEVIKSHIDNMEISIKDIDTESMLYDDCIHILHILYAIYSMLYIKSIYSLDKQRGLILDIVAYGKSVREDALVAQNKSYIFN
jgi:hypothetical protein